MTTSRPNVSGLAIALALMLALSGALVMASAPAADAASAPGLSPSTPLVNEKVVLRGAIAPARRPIVLQKKVGSRWVKVTSKRASSGGRYAFSVKATSARQTFRAVAPRAKVGSRTYSTRASGARAVRGVAGSGTATSLNLPIGNDSGRSYPVVTKFSPARAGKSVQLIAGNSVVARSRQNSDGTAVLAVPASALGAGRAFRAVTFPGNGASNIFAKQDVTVVPTARTETFNDEFSGVSGGRGLDTSKWGNRLQDFGGSRTCAKPAAGRVSVASGVASLSVRKKSGRTSKCKYGVWDNASINARQAGAVFRQERGTFAARIAMPPVRGMHGAFWLQAHTPAGVEIDVVESFGVGAKPAMTNKVHHRRGSTLRSATTKDLTSALRGRKAAEYNVYSVDWTPSAYIFRINGIETFRTSRPHLSTESQELILSLFTSDFELPRLKTPSATMKVDWVRAWAS